MDAISATAELLVNSICLGKCCEDCFRPHESIEGLCIRFIHYRSIATQSCQQMSPLINSFHRASITTQRNVTVKLIGRKHSRDILLYLVLFAGETLQQSITYLPKEETDQGNYNQHQQPRVDKAKLDKQMANTIRALELYNRVRILDAQREANNRSLMLAAAGVVVLVGGAAASVAETPVMSQVGTVVVVFGGLAELCGLIAFVRSA